MSKQYPGGIISKTAPLPTGPYETGTAPGVWTLDQQAAFVKQGIWPIAGNALPYIEDVFSTYLWSGNGSPITINNGINLSANGGLVWIKARNQGARDHWLQDTTRGITNTLNSNTTGAQNSVSSNIVSSVTTTGFVDGVGWPSGWDMASWTFREQPKFFDVVTWTSTNSSTQRTISHNLASTPGCVIIKSINNNSGGFNEWYVAHRYNLTAQGYLNRAFEFAPGVPIVTAWTDTTVTFAANFNEGLNNSYIVYIFAHDAGGFGLTGTDNVISCGSYTENGSTQQITLGYEPQFLLLKSATSVGDWVLMDTMRGLNNTNNYFVLANSSAAESNFGTAYWKPTATGFSAAPATGGSNTLIYIAIRRGPMKVPTDPTKVFVPLALNNAQNTVNTTGFPIDLQWYGNRDGNANNIVTVDRLRGVSTTTTAQQNYLRTASTAAEVNSGGSSFTRNWSSTGFSTATAQDGANAAYWNFRRAPGFFDEVCYTGANSTAPQSHNLGVVPELMIVKKRSSATSALWAVYSAALGNTKVIVLNSSASAYDDTLWNNTTPTATGFTLGANLSEVNLAGQTYVAYLFATCAGVSKVGSYTGNGTTQAIACGFTGGARFVLIKRTDSTGDWYVYDTARGMTVLTDPYLLLNSTAAETATLGSVITSTGGFTVDAAILAAINTNAASYIFLAIA